MTQPTNNSFAPPPGMQYRIIEFTNNFGDKRSARYTKTWEGDFGNGVFRSIPSFAHLNVKGHDEDTVFSLKANPFEPKPLEPVIRDDLWIETEKDLTSVLLEGLRCGEEGDYSDTWEGTQRIADRIVRRHQNTSIVFHRDDFIQRMNGVLQSHGKMSTPMSYESKLADRLIDAVIRSLEGNVNVV